MLELWCKGGKGQFSVAGNTVIFVPGQIQDRSCPPARAQADDELVAALGSVETWKRQGDVLTLIGPKPLRFRLNTNGELGLVVAGLRSPACNACCRRSVETADLDRRRSRFAALWALRSAAHAADVLRWAMPGAASVVYFHTDLSASQRWP